MKSLFLLLFLFLLSEAQSQDTTITKWCKAVINLDCRPSKNLLPDTKISEYKVAMDRALLNIKLSYNDKRHQLYSWVP